MRITRRRFVKDAFWCLGGAVALSACGRDLTTITDGDNGFEAPLNTEIQHLYTLSHFGSSMSLANSLQKSINEGFFGRLSRDPNGNRYLMEALGIVNWITVKVNGLWVVVQNQKHITLEQTIISSGEKIDLYNIAKKRKARHDLA